MSDRNDRLYPNADEESTTGPPPLSRRRVLGGSALAGAAVTAGCLGGDESDDPRPVEASTVFVFNTGNGTVSVIDAESDEVVTTAAIGMTASFPSNQYTPELTRSAGDSLWLNVDRGVRAVAAHSFAEQQAIETGSGANWQERTPDGSHLVVSAREPAHRNVRIDADPSSETFGEVTGEIDRVSEGGRGDNDGPGPCDVTMHPDGEFAYVPDLFGDTLTVLRTDPFEIHRQVDVETLDDRAPKPWMGVASWDGEALLVEHNSGTTGAESIWDVSNPGTPEERARLTADDGMGEGPLTSEIGPDSAFGYVFTPGTNDVTVVDLEAESVTDRIDLGGSAFTGTWDADRENLYVPVQTNDEVAVIDPEERAVVTRIDVGPAPYGATAGRIRPNPESIETPADTVESLTGEFETTYCIDDCACGHEL